MVKVVSIIIVLWIAALQPAFSASAAGGGRNRIAKEELIPASLVVPKAGRADIDVLYRKGHGFLPLVAIFKYLHIRVDYSNDFTVISGYYPDADHKYTFDLPSGSFKSRDTTAQLGSEQYTFTEDEVYLREDLFEPLFRIRLEYNDRSLSVRVTPLMDIPLIESVQRQRERARMLKRNAPIEPDLHIPASRAIFDIGKLAWSLTSFTGPSRRPRNLYTVRTGGDVLAGNLSLSIRGQMDKRLQTKDVHGLQRYTFTNDYLRQISFGDMNPTTLSTFDIFGLEVTNRPAARRLLFGRDQIEQRLSPDEEIELYNQGTLQNYTLSTSDTLFSYDMPLTYGDSYYRLLTYDRWGGVNEKVRRQIIPQSMIPAGEFQYSVIAGESRGYKNKYGNINLSRGFTSVLTMGTGAELYEKTFTRHSVYPYVTGVVRLTSALVGDVFISPLSNSRATLNFWLPNQGQISLSQTQYGRDDFLNRSGLLSSTAAYLALSTGGDMAVTRWGLSVGGVNSLYPGFRQRSLTTNLSMRTPAMFFVYTYEVSQNSGSGYDRMILSQSLPSLAVYAPQSVLIQGSLSYDHISNKLQSIRLFAERKFFRKLFVQLSYNRLFTPSASMIGLRLNWSAPFANVTNEVDRTNGEAGFGTTTFTNSAHGVVYFSGYSGDVFFDVGSQGDRGALLIRPYADNNGNGRRDADESYLPNTKINAQSPLVATRSIKSSKGLLLANLEPYQNFYASVNPGTAFDNPSYVPKFRTVSIASEPNVLRVFDYPIVLGGTVRGAVMFRDLANPEPVAGLTMTLRAADSDTTVTGMEAKPFVYTTKTFQDGTYEFRNIPPGSYVVMVDTHDLLSLNTGATTSTRTVTVANKADGDQVNDVNFDVYTKR